MDTTSDSAIASAASHITTTHGHLDILVNNAAIAPFSTATRAQFRDAFDTNATGPYLLSKALVGVLKKSKNPRIVNVSSGAGSIGRRLTVESPMYGIQAEAYRASKVALNMLTACLWVEFGLGFGPDARMGGEGEGRTAGYEDDFFGEGGHGVEEGWEVCVARCAYVDKIPGLFCSTYMFSRFGPAQLKSGAVVGTRKLRFQLQKCTLVGGAFNTPLPDGKSPQRQQGP